MERTPEAAAGGLRGSAADLPGAEPEGEPAGALPAEALGVGPEARVGICMERSLEMVVGLLGILKAGGRLRAAGSVLSGRAPAIHAR